MRDTSRRGFLRMGGAGLIGLASSGTRAATEPSPKNLPPTAADPAQAAEDKTFWSAVAQLYDVPDGIVHLEHGNWGAMAHPVLASYQSRQAEINRDTAYYSRRLFGIEADAIRRRVARELGVEAEEIAFTRNATEALEALIGGYHRPGPGDAVLYSDLDYDSMQKAMRWLAKRRGVRIAKLDLPEPASTDAIVSAYARCLEEDPAIRLILLTHVSHRTGLVLPVAKIVAMARAADVDVIVDSAHAWGQIDFRLPDLAADFVGLNLHKWIGAPLGVGLMYVKRSRLDAIEPYMGEADNGRITSRVRTGTINHAALLGVGPALDMHECIGPARKAARLKYLRNRWVSAVAQELRLQVLTPDEPGLYAGITSFRLHDRRTPDANVSLAATLLDEFGIFTVARTGLASGACVRVTPAVYTREADVDHLATALLKLSQRS